MQLSLVIVSCLVAVAAGSTLQDPFIHESPQDQMAVASSVRGSTLQDPFLHVHREDQLAIATGVTGAKVAAPDTKKAVDRTPTARVPAPSLDDVIVLDGSEDEAGPEPPRRAPAVAPARPAVLPAAAPALPAWLRGALPAAASYPAWLRGAAPTVVLLQPIFVPVPVPESEAAGRRTRPDYYGAADPARLRRFSLLRRRR